MNRKKSWMILLLVVIILNLCFGTAGAYEEGKAEDAEVLNPFTGLPVASTTMLAYPPVFVPIARFPSKLRPSAGLTQAQWVFELFAGGDESRPVAMYYGALPVANDPSIDPYISHVSSALFSLESLRKQYQGITVTTAISKSVLQAGVNNNEPWFGEEGNEVYPKLPVYRLLRIMEKWKNLVSPPDVNNMVMSFDSKNPEGGRTALSLFIRYAKTNQILWQYDEALGRYLRTQNSPEYPNQFTPDADLMGGDQIGVENLIILFAPHSYVEGMPHLSSYFTVNFNYIDKMPALLFRDGKMYRINWTTASEKYEIESNRLRPIRFIDENGSRFPFKHGQTWVHVVIPGNPYYEVDDPLGSTITNGSGYWKLPYFAYTPGTPEGVALEVPELNQIDYTIGY